MTDIFHGQAQKKRAARRTPRPAREIALKKDVIMRHVFLLPEQ
jgi:hypothetical protein